jgi:microfibrillar-associated protein 1
MVVFETVSMIFAFIINNKQQMSGSADPFSILNRNPNRGLWTVKPKNEPASILRKGVKPKEAIGSDDDFDIFSDDDKKAKKQVPAINPNSQTSHPEKQLEGNQSIAKEPTTASKKQLFSINYLKSEKPIDHPKKPQVDVSHQPTEPTINQKKADFEIEERKRHQHINQQPYYSDDREGEIIAGIEDAEEEDFDAVEEEFDGREDDDFNEHSMEEQRNVRMENFDEDVLDREEQDKSVDNGQNEGDNLVKLVYIPKNLRLRESENQTSDPRKAKVAKMRKANSALIKLTKALHAESENLANVSEESIAELVSDDDDQSSRLEEYKAWKIRELQRIKRDELERQKFELLKEETVRRAQMNDLERMAEDKAIGKYDRPEKSDYRYMQKYYSSFTFHQDSEDPIFKRDYNVAVGYDNFDKSVLPQRMQRRGDDFGKRGKSKYTDLLSEDTNNYQTVWAPNQAIVDRLKQRQAGYRNTNMSNKH